MGSGASDTSDVHCRLAILAAANESKVAVLEAALSASESKVAILDAAISERDTALAKLSRLVARLAGELVAKPNRKSKKSGRSNKPTPTSDDSSTLTSNSNDSEDSERSPDDAPNPDAPTSADNESEPASIEDSQDGDQRSSSSASQSALTADIDSLVKLADRLSEKLNQNSKNSHLPPSSDGPGARSGTGRKKSGRKPGGQKGHPGACRKLLPASSVSAVVDLFPEQCLGCAADLESVPDPEPLRYQQTDWCDHRLVVTEWRRHEVNCLACGARTRAAYDSSLISASAFGPGIASVIVLLSGCYHLSRRQVRDFLSDMLGLSISLGTVSAIEQRVSEALKPAYEEVQREVEQAAVMYTDATSWLLSGILRSLWVLTSAAAMFYVICIDGRRKTIIRLFGRRTGIMVSDRASVFTFWAMKRRQICWAHLIRKFVAFSQRDGPAGKIGRELLGYSALVFEYWHGYKGGLLTREELEIRLRPVRLHFERVLEKASKAGIERLSGSCKDILAHREALWTFARVEGVEPTNNHAERALRPFVLWRRRSFGCRSERGERFAERIMTVVQTARRQKKAVLEFILQSVKAQLAGTHPPRLLAA